MENSASRTWLQPEDMLKALHTINTKILLEPKKRSTLKYIAESAMRIFQADSCTIIRYDSTSQEFTNETSAGLGTQWKHLPRPDGIGTEAIKTGCHVWVTNLQELNPRIRKAGIVCAGSFPLQPKDDKPVGIMYLHFKNDPYFTENELNLVDLFSYHAGLAIQLTELRTKDERRINDLRALRDAGMYVARSSTLRESLRRVVKVVANVMHADAAIMYPWNSEKGTFDEELIVDEGMDIEKIRFSNPRQDGLTHTLMKKGILWEKDVEKLSKDRVELVKKLKGHVLSVCGLRSFIGIALKSDNDKLGVLYVAFREPHEPDIEELSTLGVFAEMAANRIQLAKLSEVRKAITETEAIAVFGAVAAQFAHRLSNVVGTTPLVILDIKELLEAAGVRNEEIYRRLDELKEDTYEIMDMAEKLKLDKDIGSTVPVDLSSIVRKAVEAAHVKSINPHVNVIIDIPKTLAPVRAAKIPLIEILVNMLRNATEANAKSIYIQASDRPGDKIIDLLVKDDGKGIPKSDLKKILRTLYTTKKRNEKGGLHGLGLWTAHHQIKQMGGEISVKSTSCKGATFGISLRTSKM